MAAQLGYLQNSVGESPDFSSLSVTASTYSIDSFYTVDSDGTKVLFGTLDDLSICWRRGIKESSLFVRIPRYSDLPSMSIGEFFDGNDIDSRLHGTFEVVSVKDDEYVLVSMDAELDVES